MVLVAISLLNILSSKSVRDSIVRAVFLIVFLFQGVGMFLGEFLCLLVFKFIWYSTARYRIERMTYKGDASSPVVRCWPIHIRKDTRLVEGEQSFNPFIFWFASICDMLSTCLSYVALNYTSASSFQMLRGSVMVFTAILRYCIDK